MSCAIERKEIEKELGLVCSAKKRINEVYIEKLSCCKWRLLMGKDKDKRPRQFSPEPQTTGVQSSTNCVEAEEFQKQTDLVKCRKQVSSFKESRSKTNGHNSANNNPMTALKYFGSSAQAFFKLLPHHWSLIPTSSTFYCNHANCHRRCTKSSYGIESPQKESRSRGRFPCCNNSSWKKFSSSQLIPSFLFVIFVLFILLIEIVQSSSASPIPNNPAPTQTITNTAFSSLTISDENRVKPSFESTKLEDDNGEENPQQRVNPVHQLMLVNNSRGLMDISNDYSAVKRDRVVQSNHGNDEFTIESAPDLRSSSDRVSFVDDYGNSDVISGNHLDELTFVVAQKHKKANKNKHDFNGGPHPKEELLGDEDGELRNQALEHPTLPTAQHQRVLQVTNDVLPSRRKQSSRNGIIAFSSININSSSSSNDTDNDSADSISFTTTSTSFTGQCWLTPWSNDPQENLDEAKETELIGVSSPKLLSFPSDSLSFKEPTSVFCNDTGNLANLLNEISETLVPQVISLHVTDSSISILNLSLFRRFPNLRSLSVTNSNVSQIIGNCPEGLKALNISFNNVKKLDGSLFGVRSHKNYDDDEEEEDDEEDEDSDDQNDDEDNDTLESESMGRNFSMSEGKGSTNLPSSAAPNSLQLQNTNKSPSASPIGKISSSSRFSKGHYSEKLDLATPVALPENNILLPVLRKSRSVKPVDSRKSHFNSHISIFHNESGAGKNVNQATQSVESSTVESESEEYLSSSKEFESDTYGEKIDNIKPKFYDERRLSGLSSLPAGGASASTISPVDSIGCGINDYLCKVGYSQELFPTQPQQMNRSEQKSDDEIIPAELKSKRLFSHKMIKGENRTSGVKKVVSEEGDFYIGEDALSPSSTFSDGGSSRSNKKGNEIKVGSKSTRFLQGVRSRSSTGDDRDSHPVRARKRSSGLGTTSNLSLEDIDLSHNKISEVPRDLLELKSLKSLRLSGNQLRCDFVWEKLADWYMNLDSEILKDGDDTFCGVVDDVRVFQYTVLGVLKAKKDVVETCRAVDKNICHDCGLYSLNKQPGHGYNLSHWSPRGSVAIALKLDCSHQNLTELPSVPPQTWQINVSGNAIQDLSSLKESMYENLLILDGDYNDISSLDGLTGTPFLDKYNYLSLQNNRFLTIPTNILTSLKNMRGQGITLLGDNFIECDCDVVKEIKPLLLENSKQIKDLKEIYCKDMKTATGAFTAVKDIQYSDLCYLETEESNEMYLYLIIVVELLLIFVIVAKVWHDQRTFRRSGVLPWCSRKIPRLPCDAMLESVKEPPHFNRSSSTNVRSFACEHPTTQSISSHVQLREVRSNSGQSEKSSQISHLSSFPCSSRTSSV